MKTLSGGTERIGPRQPVRAAAMRIAGELMHAPLHEREVVPVTGQRREALRERVVLANIIRLGKPRFLGHAEANPEKHHPLRRRSDSCRPSEPSEAERFQDGESQQRTGRPEKPAAGRG